MINSERYCVVPAIYECVQDQTATIKVSISGNINSLMSEIRRRAFRIDIASKFHTENARVRAKKEQGSSEIKGTIVRGSRCSHRLVFPRLAAGLSRWNMEMSRRGCVGSRINVADNFPVAARAVT